MNQKNNQEKKKFKFSFSEMWKNPRSRAIFLSAAVIVACAILYVVLLLTVLRPEKAEDPLPTVGNHGEQMENGRPFVMDPVAIDDLQSIRVENEFGGFHYYRGTDGEFYFEGAEHMFYDQSSDWMNSSSQDFSDLLESVSMVDSLINLVRYMLSTEEVVGYDKADLAKYGLADRGQAAVTLTYTKGEKTESGTVFFGNKTVNGNGYYVMLEGRDALYILGDTYITRCIFTDVKNYFLPQVAPSVSSATYHEVEEIAIRKKGEDFASIRALTEEEIEMTAELFTHMFTFPEGYYPSTDNLQKLLETFVNFTGEEVVEYNLSERLSDPEERDEIQKLFRLYSLTDADNNWNYELYYKYKNFDITLYISTRLEVTDGEEEEAKYIYYVYSPDFDLIAEFDAEKLFWVEWDLLTLLDNHSFSVSIDQVGSIELSYEDTHAKFTLQNEGADLAITSSNGVKVVTDNFRQLYKAILFTTMDGYAVQPEEAAKILQMKITLRDGKEYLFDFYGMTARKAYYTLNGSGEFYVNRDYIKQIISACNGILAGEEVVVDRKN